MTFRIQRRSAEQGMTFLSFRRFRPNPAFTLIELIGVLAVAAILASVLVPVLITRANLANADLEEENLKKFAQALKQAVMRNKVIPGASTWADVIATELGIDAASIRTNGWGSSRVYLIDPDLNIRGTGLPYTQSGLGATNVTEPRVMLVSSLTQTRSLPVSSGVAGSTLIFDNLWNAAEDTVPTNWPSTWTDNGDELLIQRINLRSLFKRVIFNNNSGTTNAPFHIETTSTTNYVFTTNPVIETFFLENTLLLLRDPENSGTPIQGSQILSADSEFVFEDGFWRGNTLEGKTNRSIAGIEIPAQNFGESTNNTEALNGATPPDLIEAVQRYMSNYAVWATNYNFVKTGSAAATYANLQDAQVDIKQISQDLVHNLTLPPASGTNTGTVHVDRIVLSTPNTSSPRPAIATVRVKDNTGALVTNAIVYGTFTGDYNEARSGTSNSSGEATITTAGTFSGSNANNPNGTFTVTYIEHTTLSYDFAANAETSDTY